MIKKTNNSKKRIEIIEVSTAQVDRSYKGIEEWRNAIKSAESKTSPRRKLLEDLYSEITLDTHLTSVLDKRRMKVTNTTIKFFNKDGKENEEVNKLIDTEGFEDMVKDILDSRFHGYSLLWFNDITDKKIDYKLIDRRHVRPEKKLIVKNHYDDNGIDYTDPLYSRFIVTAGKANDLGLLSKVAPWIIYKKGGVADWALYAQLLGIPFREFKYDGNDNEIKKKLEQIAKQTISAPYAVLPSTTELKIHENAGKSGSSNLFENFAKFADKQVSKAILHNVMTTDAEGGNYKGEVHQNSEKEVSMADKKFVIRILNEKLIPILDNFGFNLEGGWFSYEEKEQLTMTQRLAIDEKLAKIIDIDDEYFYDTYGIPKPKNTTKKDKSVETHDRASKKDESKKDLNDKGTDALNASQSPLLGGAGGGFSLKESWQQLLNFFSSKPSVE